MNDAIPSIYVAYSVLTAISAVLIVTTLYRRKFRQLSGLQMILLAILLIGGASMMGFMVGFHFAMELYMWQGWEISPTQRLNNLNSHFVRTVLLFNWLFVAFVTWFFIFLQDAPPKNSQQLPRV